ncbi:Serine-arginine protein 55 [Sarcoptes scabiei]|nr:Serine-arginine protein 55 [Sarcoptes scabiei]
MTGTRVYVGRISYDVRERDIEKFFKGYGRIREILLKDGFAFEFDDHRDAEDAVYELNGKDMLGERVHVEFARGQTRGRGGRFGGRSYYGSSRYSSRNGGSYSENRYGPPRNTEYRVLVENLSSRVSWQDLKDFMRQAGEVTYADAHKRERNMGIVDFATYSDMKTAIDKLDGQELHGRKIHLYEDKSRRRRSRSRSHRRGGSRSRSRSPRSRSRSKSHSDRSKSPARGRTGGDDDRDRSKSPDSRRSDSSRSRSRSRSKSPRGRDDANGGTNGSMSRSRSRSESPEDRRGGSRSPQSRDDSRSRSPSMDGKNHSDNSRNSMDAD